MVKPEADPSQCYQISPNHMELSIEFYLDPVIAQLGVLRDGYGAAHGEITKARDSQAPGWYGGAGNGQVRPATDVFLDAVAGELGQLATDQTTLVTALQEYRGALQAHIDWARRHEQECVDRFTAIQRDLGGVG